MKALKIGRLSIQFEHLFIVDILLNQFAALGDDGESDLVLAFPFDESVFVGLTISKDSEFHDGFDRLGFIVSGKEGD